jgi:hypothetical protein
MSVACLHCSGVHRCRCLLPPSTRRCRASMHMRPLKCRPTLLQDGQVPTPLPPRALLTNHCPSKPESPPSHHCHHPKLTVTSHHCRTPALTRAQKGCTQPPATFPAAPPPWRTPELARFLLFPAVGEQRHLVSSPLICHRR